MNSAAGIGEGVAGEMGSFCWEGFGVQGSGFRVQGFKGSRVQGFKGSRVQGFKGSRVQGFKGSRVQGFKGS
ncbi:MAG: hypothetical protein NTU53_11480, partial [Planctomycetota bacterium]|nr:hypothetical protein [Planctomycetota bacterium]